MTQPIKKKNTMVKLENSENDNEETSNKPVDDVTHDPYFPPIVSLPEVEVKDITVWIVFYELHLFKYRSTSCD